METKLQPQTLQRLSNCSTPSYTFLRRHPNRASSGLRSGEKGRHFIYCIKLFIRQSRISSAVCMSVWSCWNMIKLSFCRWRPLNRTKYFSVAWQNVSIGFRPEINSTWLTPYNGKTRQSITEQPPSNRTFKHDFFFLKSCQKWDSWSDLSKLSFFTRKLTICH